MLKLWFIFICVWSFCIQVHAASDEHNVPLTAAPRTVTPVLDQFFSALRKGDISRAYYSLTSEELRQATSLKEFSTEISRFSPLSRNRSVQYGETVYSGSMAFVSVQAVSLERSTNQVKFALRFEDNQWRIVGFQVFASS